MGRKFSQISPSATDVSSADFILGLQGGTADVLYTPPQVLRGLEPQLTADTTFYVATTGSDSNNGLAAGTPWLTLQHAASTILGYEMNGHTATVQIADGTYAGVDLSLEPNLGGLVSFAGNVATSSTVVVTPHPTQVKYIFKIDNSVNIKISNLICQGTGSSNAEEGVFVAGQTRLFFSPPSVNLSNVSFTNLKYHIDVGNKGACIIGGVWSHTGDMANAFFLRTGATLNVTDLSSATVVGNPNITDCFIRCEDASIYHNYGTANYTGAATGVRFLVSDGGVIQTGTNNTLYFPGSLAGVVGIGGQYDNIPSLGTGAVAVANLPPVASVLIGQRAFVNDSTLALNSSGLNQVVVGLGGNFTPVFCDGVNWRIG